MNANGAVYLDTSALAKWYLLEPNSAQVTEYIINLERAAISSLTMTEMRCLLARRKRMRELDAGLEAQIYATFLEDIAQGSLWLYPIEDKHMESAANLISILPSITLRTLDAIHLGIAQHYGFERIATADKNFAEAAVALGLRVDLFE
jgi:uncharacterized protein